MGPKTQTNAHKREQTQTNADKLKIKEFQPPFAHPKCESKVTFGAPAKVLNDATSQAQWLNEGFGLGARKLSFTTRLYSQDQIHAVWMLAAKTPKF